VSEEDRLSYSENRGLLKNRALRMLMLGLRMMVLRLPSSVFCWLGVHMLLLLVAVYESNLLSSVCG